ncbi:MAG TPA: hypothetical protein VNA25_22975, partial [Phycisphaerae bacterium]|nr:hypothetical protein [Phycisphaerae bacterium]
MPRTSQIPAGWLPVTEDQAEDIPAGWVPVESEPSVEDYDYAGARKAGIKPGPNGHWPDTYKLPNHITFSKDSKYSTDETPGGTWAKDPKGNWSYTPSDFVLSQHSPDELEAYFKAHEPDARLVMPWSPEGRIRSFASQLDPQSAAWLRGNLEAVKEEVGEKFPALPALPGEPGHDPKAFPQQWVDWSKKFEPIGQALQGRLDEEEEENERKRREEWERHVARKRKLRPIAKVFAGSPALGVAEHVAAAEIAPEDRAAFLDVAREEYAKTRAQEKAGFGPRLGTSIVQGVFDFGMPLAKMVSKAVGGPLKGLDRDQEIFRQQLLAVREHEDPTIREDTPWIGRTAQKAGRMTVPMVQSVGLGRAMGGAASGLGATQRGVRVAQSIGVSGSFLPQIADNTYSSLIAEGVEPRRAQLITAVSAPIEAAVESILPDPFAGYGRTAGATIRQMAAQNIKRFTVNYTKELAEEGIQGVINETAMEVGRRLDEDIPNKGLGNILMRGLEDMKEAAGPLGLMMAPGAMASMVEKVEAQDGVPSRADADALKMSPEEARNRETRKRAWDEKFKQPLKRYVDALKKQKAGAPDGGGGARPEVREDGGRPPEGGAGVQPGGLGDRGLERPPQEGEGPGEAPPATEEALGQPADRPEDAGLGAPTSPPGAAAVAGGPGARSIQNAYTEQRRADLGMAPRTPPGHRGWPVAQAEAAAATDAEVTNLVDRLRAKPEAVGDTEDFMLLRRLNEIENRHTEALGRGDAGAAAAAETELADIYDVSERVGTPQGRGLAARKAWIAEDDSLLGVLRRGVKAKKAPLTEGERESLTKLAGEVADLKAELAQYDQDHINDEIDRQIAETTAKRRATIESRFEQQYDTAHEYGIDPKELRERAKDRAEADAGPIRDYNESYRAAVQATGLTPAKIRDIEEGRLFEGGKAVNLAEYGGLDTKAPILAREYPALGIRSEPGDVQQTLDTAQALVEVLKDGPKRLPEWHDKLDEVAREMAAESGKELPDDFSLQREPADSFDWETGEDIPPPGKKSLAKKPRVTAKEKAAKARVRVQTAVASLKESFAALKQVGAVFDPMAEAEKQVKFLADLREVGLAYVELGVRSFNAAVARLAADLGHMSEGLRRHFEGEWRNLLGEGMVRSPVRDPSDTNELGRYARKITRWVVESGVQDREAVVDEVHRELETVKPGITRREAMDAMSGYGDFKELTKDEISKTVRAIKGQLQQLAKVQDLQSAIAESKKWLASGMSPEEAARKLEESGLLPKKTGFERRTPDDIERQLIAQVNELKKEVPVSVEAGEGQLKSALDAAKTAVRNRITDLEQEIATREKIVKTRTTLKPDVELTALRKQRNQLWEAHNKIFPRTKKTVTPEQQLAATGRALDRAIDQLAAELEAGRIGRKPLLPRRTSPEIEAKRSKLEGLRAQREELRTHDPAYQASEDARLLAAKKRELTGRLAELEDRLARKDFAKKPLRRTPEDAESLAMRHKVDAARKKVRAEVDKIARANRPTWKKALGVPVEVARAIKSIWASIDFSALGRQGGWLAASHPIKAARAQARSFRAALSDKEAFAIMEGISLRPNAKSGLYERAGLELTDISGAIVSREEMYQSTWAEHIPIVKYGVKASERAYVSQLNQQRADVFDAMVATMTRDPANV